MRTAFVIGALLLIAASADAACYKCIFVEPMDLACAMTNSGGYTRCESWANAREKGCEADGEYCAGNGPGEPEQPMVRNGCDAPRFILTSVEIARARQPRLVLAQVDRQEQ